MEDLKKKVEGMSAQNALYVYAGMALLILVLFLFGGMFKGSVSGMDVLWGKSLGAGLPKSTFGMAKILGFVAVLGMIGVTYFAYSQKKLNWKLALVPVFAFLVTAFTCKSSGIKCSAEFMMWLVILLSAAWAGFAYLRGDKPVGLEKK